MAGERLVQHPGVDKVSFTGSTEVGRHVAREAGDRLAHVSLELGGKNPSIVFPDAAVDDDLIANLLLSSRVHRQGQSCTAGSRLFLHEDIYDDVLERFVATLDAQVVGNPLDESSDIGAIINDRQFQSVNSFVQEGLSAPGITVALDGSPQVIGRTDGYYMGPTVFAGADNGWRLSREEIFGPVVVVIPWTRRRRRHRHGQRFALRSGRLRVDPRHRPRAAHRERAGDRLGAGQPGRRPDWWASPTAATSRAGSAARLPWRE